MIVDASALLAVVLGEEDAERYARAMIRARSPLISPVNYWEAAVRVDRSDHPVTLHRFDALIELTGLSIAPMSAQQAILARRAYVTYGKGVHRAGLNMGDCFAYALARETGRPLLFKGEDFAHTDIEAARAC